MTCQSINDMIKENNVVALEIFLKEHQNTPLDFRFEDMIIMEHKKEILQLLIKYNCLSQDALSLSGVFDDDNKLYFEIEKMVD